MPLELSQTCAKQTYVLSVHPFLEVTNEQLPSRIISESIYPSQYFRLKYVHENNTESNQK